MFLTTDLSEKKRTGARLKPGDTSILIQYDEGACERRVGVRLTFVVFPKNNSLIPENFQLEHTPLVSILRSHSNLIEIKASLDDGF